MQKPDIPESAIEHEVIFESHWISKWYAPNPFIALLLEGLDRVGVTLEDFTFKQETKTIADNGLIVAVKKLRTTIIIGLNKVTFRVINPEWQMAAELVEVFDTIVATCTNFVEVSPVKQETTLVFHLTPGTQDLGAASCSLVNPDLIGGAIFCGVNISKADSALSIERSLKYEGGAFFRLTRRFDSKVKFGDIALHIYDDELSALKLLGVEDLT